MRVRQVFFAFFALLPLSIAAADDAKPSHGEVLNLIQKLGNAKYAEREAATRKLALLDEVPPELRAAAKSRDAEAARRAKAVMATIARRIERRRVEQELAAINKVGFDRFIDRMVLTPGFATDERWKSLVTATQAIMDRSYDVGFTGTPLPRINWVALSLIEELPPRYTQSSRVLVDGHSARMSGFRTCLALSSGSIERLSMVQDSILIVDGDISRLSRVYNSLVICTGDLGPVSTLRNSVILVGGSFDGANVSQNSLVEAGKMSHIASGDSSVFVNLGKAPEGDKNRYVESSKSPLAALKLFSHDLLGLSIKSLRHGVLVDRVAEQSAFAAAGLRKGDVIVAIDSNEWSSHDEFRTLLRKKSAQSSSAFLIRRGNMELTLTVRFDN